MPWIAAALSCHESIGLKTSHTPNPMIPTASRPTIVNSAIGPQGRPWLTLTGAIGGRPPPPLAAVLVATAGLVVFVDLPAGLAPAAGFADGRRLPPVCGLLML